MTRNQDQVPFAIFKTRALGFGALGQPMDLNYSDQYHLGPTVLHPSTAGPSPHLNLDQEFSPCLKYLTSVTVSSLVSCYAWLFSPAGPYISLIALTCLGLHIDLITSTFIFAGALDCALVARTLPVLCSDSVPSS